MDLDRACKNADRRRIKENLIEDTLFGPTYCDKDASLTTDEKRWSGLDSFRHALDDEVEIPTGAFDALLHSVLMTDR